MFRTVAALCAALLSLPLSAEAASCPSGLTPKDGQCVPQRPDRLPGKAPWSHTPQGKRDQPRADDAPRGHGQTAKRLQQYHMPAPWHARPPSQHRQETWSRDKPRLRSGHRLHHGDRLPAGAYQQLSNPQRYGLPRGTYVRIGDDLYRVDPDAGKDHRLCQCLHPAGPLSKARHAPAANETAAPACTRRVAA